MKISPPINRGLIPATQVKTQEGFTLIELLVVIVIIGIVVASVLPSIHSDDRSDKMEQDMLRIQALLKLAKEEAVLQNEDLALKVGEKSYSFEVLGDKGWEPFESKDRVFRERKVVDGTELALKVDNLEINFGKQQEQAGEDKIPPPRIFILSSGEIMPFELILRTDNQSVQYSLKAGEDGKLKLIRPGDGIS